MEDREFMEQALALAKEAAADGEVPVGCVVVRDGEVVGQGRNRREKGKMPSAMRSWRPSTRPAPPSAAGGCGSARCM